MPASGCCALRGRAGRPGWHPVWDASDGSVFYYALGKTLHKATIAGGSVKSTELYTFKEYRGIVSPDAAVDFSMENSTPITRPIARASSNAT